MTIRRQHNIASCHCCRDSQIDVLLTYLLTHILHFCLIDLLLNYALQIL